MPCGGISIAGLLLFLDVHNPKTPLLEGLAAIDWLGVISVVGATVMLLLGLEFGSTTYPWDSVSIYSSWSIWTLSANSKVNHYLPHSLWGSDLSDLWHTRVESRKAAHHPTPNLSKPVEHSRVHPMSLPFISYRCTSRLL